MGLVKGREGRRHRGRKWTCFHRARTRKDMAIILCRHWCANHPQRFPSLHFVVQDISHHILSQAQQDVNERVTFQQYDFFEPQPVHDASVFLLRQCLHNHNDGDVVKIIRAVVPALERCGRETPLLINEMILPDNGTATRFEEHKMRQVDFLMMVELNTKERSEGDFTKLIKEADERLEITGVSKNTFGFGLIEVRLDVK